MTGYPLALFLHVVILGCLLGAGLGHLYLGRVGAAPGATPAERRVAVRGVLWFALVGDVALIVAFPAGFELASILDAYRIDSPAWRVAPWLLPTLLLAFSIAATLAASRGRGGKALAAADRAARVIVGAGQVWDGASVLFFGMTHMVEARWLAAKLSMYGFLLLLSIPVRTATLRLRGAMAGAGSADSPGLADAADGLRGMQLPVLAGLLSILVIAWLGIAKPD